MFVAMKEYPVLRLRFGFGGYGGVSRGGARAAGGAEKSALNTEV